MDDLLDNPFAASAIAAAVTDLSCENLPDELELALAYTPQSVRERLRAYFAFDQRLARIVSATSEPMLGQMRLAWWRDELGKPPGERPQGDAVLAALGAHWDGDHEHLLKCVEGWEALVVAESFDRAVLAHMVEGRSAALAYLTPPTDDEQERRSRSAAARYVAADIASRLSDEGERALAVRYGLEIEGKAKRVPSELRGLRVLEALAIRSLKRGGRPLMEGRGAALTALQAAIFRR